MRQLHVVSLSEDGRFVLLGTSKAAKTGDFSVALDAKLAAALRGELPRPGEQQAREIGVTPKEIQARLRAGESPEQIAQAAGVPVARVERFAGPVLSERERITDEARAAYLSRSRRGASRLPLGDAVDAALAETSSLRPESVVWTARRLESGHWLVQVSYVARARTRTASWVYEPQTRSVTASDPASAALGHVGTEPTPRRVLPTARPRAAGSTGARKPAAKQRAGSKPAARPAAQPVARKPAAQPAARPAAQPAARKAAAKPAARKSAGRAADRPVAAGGPVRRKPAGPPTLRVVPEPTPQAQPVAPARKPRAAGERAHVPDWADVLFGAAPHQHRTDR